MNLNAARYKTAQTIMSPPPKGFLLAYCVLFATLPWSVDLAFGTWNLRVPSEPLLVVLGLGLAIHFWKHPEDLRRLLANSIFLQISLAYILWMAISACFSTIPWVSWKYWLVEWGHWWVFALGLSTWPMLWQRALPYFIISMGGVAIYTLAHHGFYHFRADQAILSPRPFFPDHTLWAAVLVMVLFLLQKQKSGVKTSFLAGLLLFALVLSSARAALVSAMLAGTLWLFWSLKNYGRVVLLVCLSALGYWGATKTMGALQQDVSSMERLNRWSCALRMVQEKPFAGFGPGTFQFQYLDYQRPAEMTRISVHEPFAKGLPHPQGRGGGVHSEYLRVLTEMGVVGLLLWMGLLGLLVWASAESEHAQNVRFSTNFFLCLSLLTFFLQGLVNDLLHDGRVAALVWGAMAVLFATKKKMGTHLDFHSS
jgi:O-antigen ligase